MSNVVDHSRRSRRISHIIFRGSGRFFVFSNRMFARPTSFLVRLCTILIRVFFTRWDLCGTRLLPAYFPGGICIAQGLMSTNRGSRSARKLFGELPWITGELLTRIIHGSGGGGYACHAGSWLCDHRPLHPYNCRDGESTSGLHQPSRRPCLHQARSEARWGASDMLGGLHHILNTGGGSVGGGRLQEWAWRMLRPVCSSVRYEAIVNIIFFPVGHRCFCGPRSGKGRGSPAGFFLRI